MKNLHTIYTNTAMIIRGVKTCTFTTSCGCLPAKFHQSSERRLYTLSIIIHSLFLLKSGGGGNRTHVTRITRVHRVALVETSRPHNIKCRYTPYLHFYSLYYPFMLLSPIKVSIDLNLSNTFTIDPS